METYPNDNGYRPIAKADDGTAVYGDGVHPSRQFQPGSRVYHGNYGYGRVIDPRSRNGWVIVSFDRSPAHHTKCANALLTPILDRDA